MKKQLEEINAEKFGLKRISDEQKKAKNEIDRQEYKDQVTLNLFFFFFSFFQNKQFILFLVGFSEETVLECEGRQFTIKRGT